MTRTCGHPPCTELLTVSLIEAEPNFRGGAYCPAHRDIANRRRRKLRAAIASIDTYLDGTKPLPGTPAKRPDLGFDKDDLNRWRTRLKWELDGIPNTDSD